jgi:hypothetical protein
MQQGVASTMHIQKHVAAMTQDQISKAQSVVLASQRVMQLFTAVAMAPRPIWTVPTAVNASVTKGLKVQIAQTPPPYPMVASSSLNFAQVRAQASNSRSPFQWISV